MRSLSADSPYSLFSRLKSKFKDHIDEDLGGRYMAFLIEQLIHDEPRVINAIFPSVSLRDVDQCTTQVEFSFPGKNRRRRRADLAIHHARHGLVALAEIKEDDHKNSGNGAQLEDYLAFLAQHRHRPPEFSLITKHQPPDELLATIRAVAQRGYAARHLRYQDLYFGLEAAKSETARLFRTFLKENGVIYDTQIDEAALTLLMMQALKPMSHHGWGRLRTAENTAQVPVVMTKLLGNADVLAAEFYSAFRKFFGNRFTTDFSFAPYYDLDLVHRHLQRKKSNGLDEIAPKYSVGGYFDVGAQGKFCKVGKGWLYAWIGYSFDLDIDSDEKKLACRLLAKVYGKGITTTEAFSKYRAIPSQENAQRALQRLLGQATEKVLSTTTLSSSFKNRLTSLQAALPKA
jgi:hypothetical protein